MNLFNRTDKPADTADPKPTALEIKPAPPKAEAKPAEPTRPAAQSVSTPSKAGVSMASVISKALKITGELESTEDIQIDGQIDGDVRGVGVKIGQNAKVKGTVFGEEVELSGAIEGRIESKKVVLAGTARMTGDVCFQDIKIESGAYIAGNLKPELGKADGKHDAKPAAKPMTAASVSPLGVANGAAHV